MNDMYKYLKQHGYISENKKSNYQFELSEERAECIANKYNSLVKELQEKNKATEEERDYLYSILTAKNKWLSIGNDKYRSQQEEFIKYLEDEKDRLVRENSNIYEDSLGKTRLVNEDIFNKINLILQKYKEIIGDDNNAKK